MANELEQLLKQQLTHFKNELSLIEQAERRKPEVKEEIAKYEAMLEIYAGNNRKPTKIKARRLTTKEREAQKEKRKKATESITGLFKNNPDGEFTSKQVRTAGSVTTGTASGILKHLERTGVIFVSRRGGPTGVTNYYKLNLNATRTN